MSLQKLTPEQRSAQAAAILALPEAAYAPLVARDLSTTAHSIDAARKILAFYSPSAMSAARVAEAKANAALHARMTGRRRDAPQDHRPPPVSEAQAFARRFGDAQRRAAGKPPRTGL
ncbi:MAG: hypothetical protein LCH88_10415 [Proteobacteria bacterium]|nr:hypothetical protein [Pseudomonadota bacterium]